MLLRINIGIPISETKSPQHFVCTNFPVYFHVCVSENNMFLVVWLMYQAEQVLGGPFVLLLAASFFYPTECQVEGTGRKLGSNTIQNCIVELWKYDR